MERIDEYIKMLKRQLGNELSNKRLIYLDMNFWILLRKIFLNQEVSEEFSKFYNILKKLVESSRVLCPINHSVFTELLKQDSINSRINTAKVIDLFSSSVTLMFELDREGLELQYYVRQKLLGEGNLAPIKNYVWVKIPYIMGVSIPVNKNIDPETQYKIQSEFFKYSWSIRLEEMIENYLRESILPFLDTSMTANKLNKGKFHHEKEVKSISKLFKNELSGGLHIFLDTCERFFGWLNDVSPKTILLLKNKCSINNPIELCKRIEIDILNDQIGKYLPNIFINVCIHTLMRWDKTRKFKPNDLYDYEHARAALPYFNYFFTEKPLKHLVTIKPYKLSRKYDCIVESDIKVINKLLYKIAG